MYLGDGKCIFSVYNFAFELCVWNFRSTVCVSGVCLSGIPGSADNIDMF